MPMTHRFLALPLLAAALAAAGCGPTSAGPSIPSAPVAPVVADPTNVPLAAPAQKAKSKGNARFKAKSLMMPGARPTSE